MSPIYVECVLKCLVMVLYPKNEKKKTPMFKEKLRKFDPTIVFRSKILSKKEIQTSKIIRSPQVWWAIQLQESILVTIFQRALQQKVSLYAK
jgi:hypothetical protein